MNEREKTVEVMPLRDQMTEVIRKMIIRGEPTKNERISERKLSLQYGVSVTPIKEALRILQAEGFVYVKPRSGTYVVEMPEDPLIQICFMRASLEGVAAFFAARYRTEDELALMQERLDRVNVLLESRGDRQAIFHQNREFHRILRISSKNGYLIHVIDRMSSIENTIRSLLFEKDGLEKEDRVEHLRHLAIFDAVRAQVSVTAERLMVDHIRRNYLLLMGDSSSSTGESPASPLTEEPV